MKRWSAGGAEHGTCGPELLIDRNERCLDTTRPTLVGIDGAKVLRAGNRQVFEHPVIQHCQMHRLSVLLKLKGSEPGGYAWPKLARAWTENTGLQITGILEFGSAATLFAGGVGDGNRTRAVSLGTNSMR